MMDKNETVSPFHSEFKGASIDPGNPTGIAIFDREGNVEKKDILTLKYFNPEEYLEKVKLFRLHHKVAFILLERYEIFLRGKASGRPKHGFKVETMIEIWKHVFPNHITLNVSQWHPKAKTGRSRFGVKLTDPQKREMALQVYGMKLPNNDTTDAFLMAKRIWERVNYESLGRPFDALHAFAIHSNSKRFPRVGENPWEEYLKHFTPQLTLGAIN